MIKADDALIFSFEKQCYPLPGRERAARGSKQVMSTEITHEVKIGDYPGEERK